MKKSPLIVSIIAVALSIACILGLYLNASYSNSQMQVEKLFTTDSRQAVNPLDAFAEKEDSISYTISKHDINRINEHINYLADKVAYEVDKSQKNTEYDLNRVNTFLAIGLALLAIIGAILPLGINFLSKEMIEKEVAKLEAKVTASDKALESVTTKTECAQNAATEALQNSTTAVGKADTATEDIKNAQATLAEISKRIEAATASIKEAETKAPYISALVLQNSVARLLAVNGIRYHTEDNRRKKLTNIFADISHGMVTCGNDDFEKHTEDHFKHLISIIDDLKNGIQYSPIRYSLARPIQNHVDEFGAFLDGFTLQNKDNFQTLFDVGAKKIDAIKLLIENSRN